MIIFNLQYLKWRFDRSRFQGLLNLTCSWNRYNGHIKRVESIPNNAGYKYMDDKVHEYIVSKLARDVDDNEIILAVCEEQHVNWYQAKALIDEIKSEHETSIAARQLPLKTIIAVATLVIGLTLVIVTAIFLVDLLALVSGIISARPVNLDEMSIMGEANLVLTQILLNESPAAIPLVAAGFINGLGMVFGSLLGMRETWAYLIDKVSSIVWR